MKKFLDFTADQTISRYCDEASFVSLAPENRYNERVDKLLDKLKYGFKGEKNPFIYFFQTPVEASLFIFWHLVLQEAPLTGKNQFLCEAISSRSTLEFAKALKGFSMISTLISPTKQGSVCLESLASKLSFKSLCFSQRLTHPILGTSSSDHLKIASLLKEKGVYYHVDITKALGESFFDLETIDADFITFDISSICSLEGSVIFSKKPLSEFFYPSLKPSISFLESFVKGCEDLYENSSSAMLKKITLKMHFVNQLKEKIKDAKFIFPETQESLSTKIVCLPKVHADALNFMLMSKKACIELGGIKELSLPMLLEMCFIAHDQAKSSVSVCFDDKMSQDDIELLVDLLKNCYETLMKGAL